MLLDGDQIKLWLLLRKENILFVCFGGVSSKRVGPGSTFHSSRAGSIGTSFALFSLPNYDVYQRLHQLIRPALVVLKRVIEYAGG